ncbi:Gfo/Idh/MocA family oxidoreductase [Paenibacillus xylanexedens]|uniref:Choline-phosphate cytidylyltransferase n=1 Tax=Paenibacillus xylanexedens TaxID=528191 RepID=A0ABS4RUF7_PAEXY|nr:Gfo/Idh/MocA family oxidoreductase [Paenibacillus xylanexedens]MBP2246507.1 choline-phosphate cytidylyltransferase [Paenibacillus xylanexedens]
MTKVITYGTFDLFHEGHYRLLQRAKELGDFLIVGVTTEGYDQTRGKLNVIDSLMTRVENVRKTGFADEIVIEESPGQKFRDIKKFNIDIFTVGSDWTGHFDYLNDYCKVVYLERTKDISSTMLRTQKKHIQRIGIIGTGRIAERFIPEVNLVSGISTQGVYNLNTESSIRFAEKWNINSYTEIEDFFDAVDAVYIATPHETHYQYIKMSLEHGKHVLCEKPMVLEKKQAEELFRYAKEHNLVLFEGIKTAYSPGFSKLMGIACSGMIGSIRNVEACFTKLENPASRELTDLKFGGSFTELGSYTVLPIIKIFGTEFEDIRFDSIKDENGLDIFTKAHFKYPNGMGTATCGLGVKSEGHLIISGTKGYIKVDSPWWKTTYFEVHYENPDDVEKYSDRFLGDGLRYEINDFLSMINGNTESEFKLTQKDSITLTEIMEKFMLENR